MLYLLIYDHKPGLGLVGIFRHGGGFEFTIIYYVCMYVYLFRSMQVYITY